jgi:hypothetical protein
MMCEKEIIDVKWKVLRNRVSVRIVNHRTTPHTVVKVNAALGFWPRPHVLESRKRAGGGRRRLI